MDSSIKVIGIAGVIGAGKSKTGEMLAQILREHDVLCGEYALAGELKRILRSEFGWIGVKPLPPKEREAAQILGTELGRNCFDENIWISKLERVIEQDIIYRTSAGIIRPKEHWAIVDDVRFPNEAQWVRDHGHLLFMEGRAAENLGVQNHASEVVDHAREGATIIDNSQHLAYLYDQLLGFCIQYHIISEPSDLFAPAVAETDPYQLNLPL